MAETTAAPVEAVRPERCANCNAKLPDTPVSLCPYCAMPLLEERPAEGGTSSPNAGRIARVREHEDFEAAIAWAPSESLEYQRGSYSIFCGKMVLVLGSALVILAAALARAVPLGSPLAWVGVIGAIAGVALILRGRARKREAVALPLLKRAGLILDRRSETVVRGWTGSTTYYFKIEFEDGVVGEFAYAGRGAQEEPYVNNLPGVAYTRGPTLLHFRHIRV